MYNEELKREFIKNCCEDKASVNRAIRLFNMAEKFENSWEKDICTVSEEYLGEALQEITSAHLGTQTADMYVLKKYARWCIENKVPGACGGLLKNQDIGYDKLRTTMVGDPAQLQNYLDKVFLPISDCRADNLCRGFFWLAFIGLAEDEAAEIKVEHVDLKNLSICYHGNTYPIYNEAIPAIRYLCSANSFFYDFKRYETVIERDVGTHILRGTRSSGGVNTDSIGRLASSRVSAATKMYDEKVVLRYKSIRMSGIFYRMLEIEKRTGSVDAKKYLRMYFPDTDQLVDKRMKRKEVEFETDYRRWKTAFNK